MRFSSVLTLFAFGFMLGTVVYSAIGFSWWLAAILVGLAIIIGIVDVVDGSKETLFLFFLFLSIAAGFLRASTFAKTFSDSEQTFWNQSRAVLMEKADNILPPAEAAVFNAMVFGYEKGVSSDLKTDFNVTGTRHILAISGMNISIIAAMLLNLGLMIGLWKKHAFWFAVAGVVAFIFLVGSPPSAVRAGIMGIMLLWAKNRGRLVEEWRPVFIAAFIMTVFDPTLIVFDIGFQLSFLAVIGIIFFNSFWSRVFKFIPVKFARDLLSMSMAAQITTLPVLAYNFGTVSVISPIANIFVVPLLTPIMFLGLGFSALFWWSIAAKILLWPCWLILKADVAIVRFFADFKWASVETGQIGLILYAIYFPALFLFWKFLERKGLTESNQ